MWAESAEDGWRQDRLRPWSAIVSELEIVIGEDGLPSLVYPDGAVLPSLVYPGGAVLPSLVYPDGGVDGRRDIAATMPHAGMECPDQTSVTC